MNSQETIKLIESEKIGQLFSKIYGEHENAILEQKNRYKKLTETYQNVFGDGNVEIFSAPGRTEIGGNHTDHNHGKVLAASINLDCIGIAGQTENDIVRIFDITYKEDFSINLSELDKIGGEKGSIALVRGILSGFRKFGYKIGGFNVCVTSDVISAAGVSSSASFEMLICSVINTFFNKSELDKVAYARIGQYAENVYWDKQSGLLDQMACAVGGLIAIDFEDPSKPVVARVDFDFMEQDYNLIIVNTGKNHADLSEEYSSIPIEMKAVAKHLGHEFCREITLQNILDNLGQLRETLGDRAVLRAMHFFAENQRVDSQVKALKDGDFELFLNLINESGNSSWKWLQNCYSLSNYKEQGITVALALTETFIKRKGKGACRVHGGGFAGVIMAFIPNEYTGEYIGYMQKLIGENSVYNVGIRQYGAVHINELLD